MLALHVEGLVGSSDEFFEGVLWLQLCQPNCDGTMVGFCQVRVDGLESLSCHGHAQVHKRADELIAPEPDDQVVGPEMLAHAFDRPTQELVSCSVAERIVCRFQAVHIDEGEDEGVFRSLGSGRLALQLQGPRFASISACECIDRGDCSLLCRDASVSRCGFAIICCLHAITGSSFAVSQGSSSIGRCRHIERHGSFVSRLGALIPGFAAFVPILGSIIMSLSSVIPIFGAPVPVGADPAWKVGILLNIIWGRGFFVHDPIISRVVIWLLIQREIRLQQATLLSAFYSSGFAAPL